MKPRDFFPAILLTITASSPARAQMPAAWNSAAVTSGVDFLATGSSTTMTWSDTTAWSGGVAPNTASKTVSLEPRQTGEMTVTVDGTYTIGSLTSRNPNNNLAFTGPGKLIFDNGSNPAIWNLNSRTTRFTNLRPDINVDIQLNSNLEIRMGSARSQDAAVGRIGKIISGIGNLKLTLGQNDGATNRLFKLGSGGTNSYSGGTEIRHIGALSGAGQYGAGFTSQSATLLVNAASAGTFGTGDVVLNSQGLNQTAVIALNQANGGLQLQLSANNVMASTAKLTQSGNGAGLVLLEATQQTIAGLETTGTLAEQGRKRISSLAGAALTLNTQASHSYSYGGVISGSTTVTVAGTGIQTFTNSNTYAGATTVNTGTLALTGSGSITNSSMINVSTVGAKFDVTGLAGNFTLGASQTVGGAGMLVATGKTVTLDGTLSPGNSPGMLVQDGGTLQLGANGNLNWQVHDTDGVAGTGYDTMSLINGSSLDLSLLSSSNPYNINLWSLSGIGPDANGNAVNFNNALSYTWTLFSTGTAISGFNPNLFEIMSSANNGTSGFSNALGGGSFGVALADGNTDLVLQFTAIPEPATSLIGGLGLLTLLRRKRPSGSLPDSAGFMIKR
jgi:autotransporter-associated beta strand protein